MEADLPSEDFVVNSPLVEERQEAEWNPLIPTVPTYFPSPTACLAVQWMLRIWCRRHTCVIKARQQSPFAHSKRISARFSSAYAWINSSSHAGSGNCTWVPGY